MNKRVVSVFLALSSAAAILAQNGSPQGIAVIVNGQPVRFEGVGARQINGRVMVPLRGVMEQLGAYVSYDAASHIVRATKDKTSLELTLGSRTAMVNGAERTLDVPAQIIGGSTLVPLRFMSEALGADVNWNASTYSVTITTTVVSAANEHFPGTGTAALAITSFDIDGPNRIRPGSTVKFTMAGTPGGIATVRIPGVTEEIALSETSPGHYSGVYTMPTGTAIAATGGIATGKLQIGAATRVMQAGTALQIETEPAMIGSTSPADERHLSQKRPDISASFDSKGGVGIDPATCHITLDGRDVSTTATINANQVIYRPDQDLREGRHEVEVTAKDMAGNRVTKRWSFFVDGNSTMIKTFTLSGPEKAKVGDQVTLTLLGEPGATATFSIGDHVTDQPMREVEPGKYVANYTIKRGDKIRNSIVTAHLRTSGGDTFTAQPTSGFEFNEPALQRPSLTSPISADYRPKNHIVLHGTGAPGSRVAIKIDYLQGQFQGQIDDFTVDVAADGTFVTKLINLSTGHGARNVTYTVTAVTLGPGGTRSEPNTLTIKR